MFENDARVLPIDLLWVLTKEVLAHILLLEPLVVLFFRDVQRNSNTFRNRPGRFRVGQPPTGVLSPRLSAKESRSNPFKGKLFRILKTTTIRLPWFRFHPKSTRSTKESTMPRFG